MYGPSPAEIKQFLGCVVVLAAVGGAAVFAVATWVIRHINVVWSWH